jgi:hypothetical protein
VSACVSARVFAQRFHIRDLINADP